MKIKDYPPVFWSAIVATIVGGWMSIAAYSAMMHSDDAVIRAAGIFITLECVSIFAAATLNTKGQGLLVGLAFTLIVGCATAEIFLGASELQRGVMQMTETAKASTAGTANSTANATALTAAQAGLNACQKRYPRKVKDASARKDCSKSFEATIASLTTGKPVEQVAFNAEAAAMLAQWEAIAAIYNDNVGENNKIEAGQIAMVVMLFIFSVFVIGKLFLWAKYSKWKNEHGFNDESNSSTVVYPENEIGELKDPVIENQSESKTRPGFGLIPTGRAVLSSADRNRALHEHVKHACNTHEHVNKHVHVDTHAHVNNMHVSSKQSSDKSTNYDNAANAKVGSMIDCPQCGATFRKANKWHTFCQPVCRDNWHNAANPDRLNALKAKRKAKQ